MNVIDCCVKCYLMNTLTLFINILDKCLFIVITNDKMSIRFIADLLKNN